MNYTFGLIGCGNMGSAVARTVSQVTHNGILANRTPQRAQKLAEQLSFSWGSNAEAAEKSRFLFLGVKPHLMSDVLQELQPVLAARETKPILVSMAAGLTISQLEEMAGGDLPCYPHHAKYTGLSGPGSNLVRLRKRCPARG